MQAPITCGQDELRCRTTYRGKVINGVIVLESGAKLPDGTRVRVELLEDRPLLDLLRVADQAPPNPSWPPDGAAEVDHYLYGTPKREP